MNRTFFEFNDMATASNIEEWEPNLAGGLKMTMERFIDYSRSMAPDSEVEDVEVTPVLSARVYEQDDVPSDSVLSSPSTGQQFTPSGSRSPRNEMSEIVVASALGYETTFEMAERAELVNAESSSFGNAQNTHFNSLDDSTWAPIEPLPSYGAEIPSLTGEQQCLVPCMNVTLPPPPSYSFQETSFARRLIRSTLETAVRLMTDPNGSREDILRFCKDTFTWTTPPRCLNKLRQILSRSTHESLEFWGAPQWHIGGAGLHFPRVGIDAGSAPPPNWKSMGPTGPRRLRQAKKPVDELSASPTMDLSGIEGEWFDSNDVEQYLRTRGVYLDGQSTWAEISIAAEVPLETNLPVGSPTDSSINSTGGPQSPISLEPSPSSDGRILQTADHLWSNQTAGVPNFSDTELGILFDDSWTYSPKSLDASSIFQMNAYPKPISNTSKLYVDVEKFVKGFSSYALLMSFWLTGSVGIVDSSVCLGRTPGFRRSAVDSALHSAIQEVY